MTYWMFKDKNGEYRWHLDAGTNKIIATSGEGYKDKADCEAAIKMVKGSAAAPVKEKP
jgi:uncharacterized protein YegP (UPF0339 family)